VTVRVARSGSTVVMELMLTGSGGLAQIPAGRLQESQRFRRCFSQRKPRRKRWREARGGVTGLSLARTRSVLLRSL
ncbi:hypothetical protein, partial [Streptosporangium jomthongense]